ncbi:MAG TPA: class I SAM-dependent methyltransferase [Burkholderiales bacterium]|nr:class I SAM-dependent methyltransferase [Burkholderiales bacterium]
MLKLTSLRDKGVALLSRAYKTLYKGWRGQRAPDNYKTLDRSSENELRAALFKHYYGFASEEDFQNDRVRLTQAEKEFILNTDLPAQLFSRIKTTRERIIPWLDDQVSLSGKKILEIGAGTGCAAVALAEKCDWVTAVDIEAKGLQLAEIRANLYGVKNIDFMNTNATEVFDAIEPKKYKIVIFYACLEHMTMDERIVALSKAWKYLEADDYLIIIESPNRLFWYDSHTAFMPFFHTLPYELALKYVKHSPRPALAKSLEGLSQEDAFVRLSRWGMGFGYQEIEVALETTVSRLRFMEDLVSFELRTRHFALEEDALNRKTFKRFFEIRNIEMPPIGFFNLNVDIILQKTL